MKVINFFGAPSSGKTTATSGLHHEMKKRWIDAELVQEHAKELVMNNTSHLLSNQLFIFAEQERRLNRNLGKTSVCVSESPLILSAFYSPPSYADSFIQCVFDFFHEYDNINFFVNRSHAYSGNGRIQDEAKSDHIAKVMKQFLQMTEVPYYEITASDANPRYLLYWLAKEGLIEVPDFAQRFQEQDIPPDGWIQPVMAAGFDTTSSNLHQNPVKPSINMNVRKLLLDIQRLPTDV